MCNPYEEKINELQANVRCLREYRDACMIALTETWLNGKDCDTELSLDGFGAPLRLDRDPSVTGKSQGGGVCLYVNNRWAKTVMVREEMCTADIELLTVSIRPFYLPREFQQLFISVVYIHPKSDVQKATDIISQVVQRYQLRSPDAPHFIMGDFNKCSLEGVLNFQQYIDCPTRHQKTLDLCYGSIPDAYRSFSRPPIGCADHNAVSLQPCYKPVLQRARPVIRSFQRWTDDNILQLQDCFDRTEWDIFKTSCVDNDELADVVSSYIHFCEESVIPRTNVRIYSNNKPWVTKSLKYVLNEKKRVFLSRYRFGKEAG